MNVMEENSQSRVVIVTDFFPPEPGNRSRRMQERCESLIKKGCSVVVICPDRGENYEFVSNSRLLVIRVKPWFPKILPSMHYWRLNHLPKFLRPFFGYFRWIIPALRVLKKLENSKTSILYSMNNPILMHVIGGIAKNWYKGWIAEMRDPICSYEFSRRGIFSFLDSIIERRLVKKADIIFLRKGIQVSAETLKNKYKHSYSKKIRENPDYGVNLKQFEKSKLLKTKKKKNSYLGIYAGTAYNNVQHLIDALEFPKVNLPEILIDFYGSRLDKYKFNDSCIYRGLVTYDNLLTKYQTCDFTIAFDDSFDEEENKFLPSKFVELIALKKCILVICHKYSYMGKLVENNRIGVVASNDVDSIIDALRKIKHMIAYDTFNNSYYASIKSQLSNEPSENKFYSFVKEVDLHNNYKNLLK